MSERGISGVQYSEETHQHSEQPGSGARHDHPLGKLDVLFLLVQIMDSLQDFLLSASTRSHWEDGIRATIGRCLMTVHWYPEPASCILHLSRTYRE